MTVQISDTPTYEKVKSEVLELLKRFQEGYTKRDVSLIDSYMDEIFSKDEDVLIIGTGDIEWCLGFEGAREIIESDWKYWGNVSLNMNNAQISYEKNTAWLYTDAVLTASSGAAERHLKRLLENVKKIASGDEPPKQRVLEITRSCAWSLLQLEKAGELQWPFRFTAVAVKKEGKWLFHQMQFSFPSIMPCDVRYDDICRIDHKILKKGNAPEDIQWDIRSLLKRFQDGYTQRDLNIIDEYMNDLFSKDDDTLVIGTGYGEIMHGFDGARELIESDWKYWWDAIIDIDDAMVSSNGNTAWVAADAYITKTIPEQKYYEGLLEGVKEDMESSMDIKGKVLHTLEGAASVLCDTQYGEKYFRPFRFTAVFVRRYEKWHFKQIQFSFPTTMAPDVRLVDGKALSGFIEL